MSSQVIVQGQSAVVDTHAVLATRCAPDMQAAIAPAGILQRTYLFPFS
jgi:hypothetical protein